MLAQLIVAALLAWMIPQPPAHVSMDPADCDHAVIRTNGSVYVYPSCPSCGGI